MQRKLKLDLNPRWHHILAQQLRRTRQIALEPEVLGEKDWKPQTLSQSSRQQALKLGTSMFQEVKVAGTCHYPLNIKTLTCLIVSSEVHEGHCDL